MNYMKDIGSNVLWKIGVWNEKRCKTPFSQDFLYFKKLKKETLKFLRNGHTFSMSKPGKYQLKFLREIQKMRFTA
jgi:hypothetical protein